MEDSQNLERLISLFEEFLNILQKHRGQPYMRSIMGILAILMDEELTIQERIAEAASTYTRLWGGMGTLGDFAIWDEDSDKSFVLNTHFNNLTTEISRIFNLYRPPLRSVEEGYPPGHIYWTLVDKEEGKKNIFKSLQEFITRIFRRS